MTVSEKIAGIANEVLSQARTSIVMRMRFMDMPLFRLRTVPAQISLASDGEHMYYSPEWILKRYRQEPEAVTRDYMHTLLHCVFRHMFLHTLVDEEAWDLACDIAVESIIQELDIAELKTGREAEQLFYTNRLKGEVKPLTAEKLYRYFLDNPDKMPDPELFRSDDHTPWHKGMPSETPDGSRGDGADGGHEGGKDRNNSGQRSADGEQPGDDSQESGEGNGTGQSDADSQSQDVASEMPAQASSLEQEWRDISEHVQMDLETFSKQQGTHAGSFIKSLGEVNREKYDYTAFLKKFAVTGEAMKINDDEFDYIYYTYGLKRYGKMPLIEPLEYKDVKRIREFVIAIDTSGSTMGGLVRRFLTKTYNILKSSESFFSKVNIRIIQCDADIQEDIAITSTEEFEQYIKNFSIRGGGGTDFRPVFRYVDELIKRRELSRLKGLIYFTDGMGTYPEKMPPYKTAFVFMQDEFCDVNVPAWAIKLILDRNEI